MTSSTQKSEASVLPNDWLECIGRHRTLEVTAHELAATRQRFDRAQCLHDDFGRQRHTRLIALRGNDLLVAVGAHIRVLDLDAAKDCWIQIAPELLDAGKSASDSNWLLDVPYKVKLQRKKKKTKRKERACALDTRQYGIDSPYAFRRFIHLISTLTSKHWYPI